MTQEETTKPKSHGKGSCSGTYYKIEVRSWHMPRVLTDPESRQPFIIDKDWKEWPVRLTFGNAPAPSMPVASWERHAAEHGLMPYEAAMGHLYGMYAFLAANHMDLCIQARLVAVRWEESYSMTEENVSHVIAPPRQPGKDFVARAESDEAAKKQEA